MKGPPYGNFSSECSQPTHNVTPFNGSRHIEDPFLSDLLLLRHIPHLLATLFTENPGKPSLLMLYRPLSYRCRRKSQANARMLFDLFLSRDRVRQTFLLGPFSSHFFRQAQVSEAVSRFLVLILLSLLVVLSPPTLFVLSEAAQCSLPDRPPCFKTRIARFYHHGRQTSCRAEFSVAFPVSQPAPCLVIPARHPLVND